MDFARHQSVPIEQIDPAENWSLSPFADEAHLEELRLSINDVGLLHPPILQQTGNTSYRIINGQKRIRITRNSMVKQFFCHVLPKELPLQQVLKIHLTEQQLSNPLSTVEQACFLRLCLQHLDAKVVVNGFLALLDRPAIRTSLNRLLGFLQLDHNSQRLLHQGKISEKTASILLELDQTDQTFLSHLFVELSLGQGKQNRLLMLSRDLHRRCNTSIESIFSSQEIQTILHHPGMNPPQKTNHIIELLHKRHSPGATKAQETFNIRKKQLALPKNCQLEHSQAFEKDEVTLSITFPDLDDCKSRWPAIRHVLSD